MATPRVKVVAQRHFSTIDRWGTILANKGDVLYLSESVAARLIKFGKVKKYRPPRKKEGEK